jgi:acetyl-CoA carboxylase biotin carboxyl carrier protein
MAKLEPDDDLIRRLAALLEETGLSEIEYEAGGQRIRVGRTLAAAAPAATPTPVPTPAPGAALAPAAAEEGVPAGTVVSPMVGTVYVSPEPGAPPFVKVGDEVKEGQTLLIIEAMKVMNPLASPRAGKVKHIFIRDGQPVEFGEPLIVVE